jgi:hypothetical protein
MRFAAQKHILRWNDNLPVSPLEQFSEGFANLLMELHLTLS